MMKQRDKNTNRTQLSPLIDRRQIILGCLTLLGMAVLLIVGLTPRTAAAPDPRADAAQAGSQPGVILQADCQVIQHMRYTPCGHELTRRQALPPELAGKTRPELEATYDLWQVVSFAADQVEMEQALDMYCAQHLVLMPDESGRLCVFENKYGDALALVAETELLLSELPDSYQEEVRPGRGFDTREELDMWLEAADS